MMTSQSRTLTTNTSADYETKFNPELFARPKSKAQEDQTKFANDESKSQHDEPGGFRLMYYTNPYKPAPEKIEMFFRRTTRVPK